MSTEEQEAVEFDEVMTFAGVTFARKGRFMFQVNENTPEQQTEFLVQMKEIAAQLESEIETDIADLETVLLKHNPFDVIANSVLRNAIHNPETYREYSHDGNQAYVEYLALLCLTRPLDDYALGNRYAVSGEIVEDIQDRIATLFRKKLYWLAFKDIDPQATTPPSTMVQLRMDTLFRCFLVRNPAYYPHLRDTLTGLFGPMSDLLQSTLGFTIDDALAVVDSIDSIINASLVAKRAEAQSFEKLTRKAVTRYRLRQRSTDGVPMGVIKGLATLKPSESADQIRSMAIGGWLDSIGDLFCVTVNDLHVQTSIDPVRISAFLERVSLECGSVQDRYRHPAPTHPLSVNPVIKLADSYFCPIPEMLHWALQPAIEDQLNPDTSQLASASDDVWASYTGHRGNFLEEQSLALLKVAMPHSQIYHALRYSVVEEGESKEVELDGLVILDTALFLVEAKSGSVTPPARRGAPLRMEEDLRSLVQEAHEQALRAKSYVSENPDAKFRLPDGGSITVRADEFEHIFLVNVTLDNLDAFVTSLYRLTDAGILGDDLPWSVALTDLMVICELVEFSSQLIHYLTRRLRLNELGFTEAHDELDWFGHYLQEGLYFEDALDEPDNTRISLLSYTTEFDDFYLYQMGVRQTPAPAPRQPMPDVMRQILAELEDAHPQGYLQVACALLDMGTDSRERFAATATELRRSAQRQRRIRDFSLGFSKAGFGISFIFAPKELVKDLEKRLEGFCAMKKYQARSERWIGLSCVVDDDSWLFSYIILKQPWVYDDILDRLVRDNLLTEDDDLSVEVPCTGEYAT